jgi:hypothetical protein
MAKFSICEHKKPHRAKRAGGGLGHRGGLLRGVIQDPANGLPRISILGNSVNNPCRVLQASSDAISWASVA